jgi:SAM-dependent methyltransferase
VLTVDFDRLGLQEGDRLLDLGCGAGRHSFEALRRGAHVVALDQNTEDLRGVAEMVEAMAEAGEIKPPDEAVTLEADALDLPFADGHFDRVLASEILEHIPDDRTAITEIARVTRSGGTVAVTVPRRWTEQVCWRLSDEYHNVEGGHVRIYRGSELTQMLVDAGLVFTGQAHAHALHSPYWWLKCAVGVNRDTAATRAYHRVLVWDMMKRPWLTQSLERALDPVLGKSLVLYFEKP